MDNISEQFMNTMGMARRAGKLIVGQDNVFAAMKRDPLLVIVTDDCSASVLRSLGAGVDRGTVRVVTMKDTDRTVLGAHLGVGSAQVAALPLKSGFAKKALSLYDRSDANEQNQSI
ncbi:MAG: hypothetical protein LLF78_00250 [Synergistaceae bacterium]|nr:hypothetical protein [Synergistaceae bacterium]